jgi:hypothetical protein
LQIKLFRKSKLAFLRIVVRALYSYGVDTPLLTV